MDYNYIKTNIIAVKNNIRAAAERSGRNAADIALVAVSKTVGAEAASAAASCGITDFGENRVQELLLKQKSVEAPVRWHMIGHLQTNKVRDIIGKVKLIHSLDSVKLAGEIDAQSKNKNVITDCLIEVNIAREPSKYGVMPENARDFASSLSAFGAIRVKGLMCVAPYTEIAENNRKYFTEMRELYIDIQQNCDNNIDMKYLSMGMTGDYAVAVEEGANIVRIGTGIFGARQ